MENERTVFRLFAVPTTDKTVAEMMLSSGAYMRITGSYSLIYTDGEQPGGSVEVKGEDLSRLTDMDNMWLFDCNMEILEKWRREHAEAEEKGRIEFMSRLLDELEAEREARNAEKGGTKCLVRRKTKPKTE